MQHTCNQANDLIIVIQCNGFVSVVRNAFFLPWAFGLFFFFFLPATVFGIWADTWPYIYICICKCMYVYVSTGVFSLNENETDKKKKINDILIFLLHLLPRTRRLKIFVTPCMVTLCNFFPSRFDFRKKKYIYVCTTTFMPFFFSRHVSV
jgi:hypothetical protein